MKNYMNLIEELSLNAWPSHMTEIYDGWLLRFSENYTHRTNSVNLIGNSTIPLDEKIRYCEERYHQMNTPCIFKISPTQDPSFDTHLEELGYHKEHIAYVMTADLSNYVITTPHTPVHVTNQITDEWISRLFYLNGTTNPNHLRIVPSMFKAIPKQTIVAHVCKNGTMVASGLGVLDRDHVGIYAIYVDANYRSQGIARSVCTTLLNEAIKQGATKAYLQVVQGNEHALSLYQSLGFSIFYPYWFRVK